MGLHGRSIVPNEVEAAPSRPSSVCPRRPCARDLPARRCHTATGVCHILTMAVRLYRSNKPRWNNYHFLSCTNSLMHVPPYHTWPSRASGGCHVPSSYDSILHFFPSLTVYKFPMHGVLARSLPPISGWQWTAPPAPLKVNNVQHVTNHLRLELVVGRRVRCQARRGIDLCTPLMHATQ